MKLIVTHNNLDRHAALLQRIVTKRIAPNGDAMQVSLSLDAALGAPESYRIACASGVWQITASDNLGLYYGIGKFLHGATWHKESFTPVATAGVVTPACPFRATYYSVHFHNWYHEAPVEELIRYTEEVLLYGYNTIFCILPIVNMNNFEDETFRMFRDKTRTVYRIAKDLGMKIGTIVNVNQGLKTSPDAFAAEVADMVRAGVRIVGGCCGTTPAYIRALRDAIGNIAPVPILPKQRTVVSSYTHAVALGEDPILIGERINPTGKKRFRQALAENDIDYILDEGFEQQEKGVHILDVNVGMPGIDEAEMLCRVCGELQAVIKLPLQIDTSDVCAMEAALRRYNGKAMINSVNGKAESMRAVFPLAKKYGGVVVALTLDEDGIPARAEGRLAIAEKILAVAAEYGIDRKDLIFDPLCLTVSADPMAATETLRAVRMIREKLGCHTSLGVSNVSFGLPARDTVNAVFFAQALENRLSAAIMNPYSLDMMKAWHAHRVLHGLDENCADYIDFSARMPVASATPTQTAAVSGSMEPDVSSALQKAIVKGLCAQAGELTDALLVSRAPLEIVQNEIIPALDAVGRGFENKTVYLPQLLMSAEAAKAAFTRIKACVEGGKAPSRTSSTGKCVVLATVHGDIHDIGKNIVRLLLENYGFDVVDLGKDVPAEVIADTVVRLHAPLVGLSALMTTTVPAMQSTIDLLRLRAPWCKIAVGGAVLTAD
ncbi:MAG: dihydropteroate synthase, partial [Clostridia bacterium]|nr:dihydropteroate synthase [Clostridia bacterium]